MRNIKEFLGDQLGSETISQPRDLINDISDGNFIMQSKDDIINVEFFYKDEHITHQIRYKDIKWEDGADQWYTYIKSKEYDDIKYYVVGDHTGTGHIGYSTINMIVDVIKNKKKIKTLIPECSITTTANPIFGITHNIKI